jgi:ATP-binding cassette subfamily B protein
MTTLVENKAQAPIDISSALSQNRLAGLWGLMQGYRWHYFGAAISLGVAAVSKTATYLLLRYFADQVLTQNSQGALSQSALRILPMIALGFVGLALFEGLFTFLSGRLAAQTAESVALRLRNYLFDHIQRLTFSYHDKTKTGELVQRCTSDVEAIRRFYADQAIGVGRIVLLFTVNFIAILNLNAKLALLSVLVTPLIIVTSIFFFRRVSKAYEAYQDQDAILTTTLQENLSGVRVVKAFAQQKHEIDKFEGDNLEKFNRGRSLLLMHSSFWPVSDIMCGLQMLAGFTTGAIMAINGTISAGTYLAYAGMVVWLIWPMRNLGRLIVQTSTGMVSFNRVLEVIREERENLEAGYRPPNGALKGAIQCLKVGLEYDSGVPVLHDINFYCEPGQTIALLGPTGSGKTSLVNLLPRFYNYTAGSMQIDGVEVKQLARDFLRQQIGIVEQEPILFSRTIRENITYGVGREVNQDEIEATARAAAIHDVILSFPQGYDTLIGERGVTLSGGQKQRVAIARTLLKDPKILILDDSTSSVDTETEALIRSALINLMKGRTSFIIAHRIQSVMEADLILVLDSGRIVQRGTHDELVNIPGIYQRIFQMQTMIESELDREISGLEENTFKVSP